MTDDEIRFDEPTTTAMVSLDDEEAVGRALGWQSRDFVIPSSGEIVNLDDAPAVASALADVGNTIGLLMDAKKVLQTAMIAESQRQGTKTLHFGEFDVVIEGGPTWAYDDPHQLRQELADAGLPEDRLMEAVPEVVSYETKHGMLKRLAVANRVYKAIIDGHRVEKDSPYRARVVR